MLASGEISDTSGWNEIYPNNFTRRTLSLGKYQVDHPLSKYDETPTINIHQLVGSEHVLFSIQQKKDHDPIRLLVSSTVSTLDVWFETTWFGDFVDWYTN